MKAFRQMGYIITKLVTEPKKNLGRWNRLNCVKKEERVVYYANMDHCGDCGKLVVENKK